MARREQRGAAARLPCALLHRDRALHKQTPVGGGSEQGGSELRPQSLGLATPSTSKKKLLKELQISDKAWSCPAPGTGWQHPGVTQRHGAAGAATTDDLQPKGFVMGSGARQGAAGAGREAGGPAEAA